MNATQPYGSSQPDSRAPSRLDEHRTGDVDNLSLQVTDDDPSQIDQASTAEISTLPGEGTPQPGSRMPPRKLTLSQRLDPRLVLENSGSVARDHLASERTFLAYVRTSLVIASTGVGLVQLFTIAANSTTTSNMVFIPTSKRLQTYARPLGATIIAFSLIILVAGVIRYFTIQKALLTGMFPAARMFIFALTLILTVIIAIVFGVLIAGT